MNADSFNADVDAFLVDLRRCRNDPTCVESLLKARPKTEGDDRFVFCEPSNEKWDSEDEKVLGKALADSTEHYLRFGNIDLNHLTLFGWRMGIENPHLYEIGIPVEVIADGKKYVRKANGDVTIETGKQYVGVPILLKSQIYRNVAGDKKASSCAIADFFWESLTGQEPAQSWHPSIGGHKPKKVEVAKGKIVTGVRWVNTGFAKEPVNHFVKPVSTMAPAEFAKAVTAGYTSDVAGLTGGGALRRQSLHGAPLHHRRAAAKFLKHRARAHGCAHTTKSPLLREDLCEHFHVCEGFAPVDADLCATRLLGSVSQRIQHVRGAHRAAA